LSPLCIIRVTLGKASEHLVLTGMDFACCFGIRRASYTKRAITYWPKTSDHVLPWFGKKEKAEQDLRNYTFDYINPFLKHQGHQPAGALTDADCLHLCLSRLSHGNPGEKTMLRMDGGCHIQANTAEVFINHLEIVPRNAH